MSQTIVGNGSIKTLFSGEDLPGEPGVAESRTTSLDSFTITGTRDVLKGDRWHELEMHHILRRQAVTRIRGICINASGDLLFVNTGSTSRYAAEGVKRTEARIYSFIDYLKAEGYDTSQLHFLTLTTRHRTSGTYTSHRETLYRLREGWDKLRLTLKNEGIEYLKVTEPGEEKGYPHLHIVLAGGSDGLCERLVALWCDKYGLGLPKAQKWSVVENIENAGAYLRKYLIKQYDGDWNKHKIHFAELCYREKVRTFCMSRKASAWINDKYRDPLRGLAVVGELELECDGEIRTLGGEK